jgi:hypothetical protein
MNQNQGFKTPITDTKEFSWGQVVDDMARCMPKFMMIVNCLMPAPEHHASRFENSICCPAVILSQ